MSKIALFINGNCFTQRQYMTQLAAEGFQVEYVSSVASLQDYLKKVTPDVIIIGSLPFHRRLLPEMDQAGNGEPGNTLQVWLTHINKHIPLIVRRTYRASGSTESELDPHIRLFNTFPGCEELTQAVLELTSTTPPKMPSAINL